MTCPSRLVPKPNGTTGISAGYATNIPPHNLGEIIDATIKRIDSPNCYLDTIMEIVKGPDFPTGGIVEGIDGIRSAFETGRGKIIVKAKTNFEEEIAFDFDIAKQGKSKRQTDLERNNKDNEQQSILNRVR